MSLKDSVVTKPIVTVLPLQTHVDRFFVAHILTLEMGRTCRLLTMSSFISGALKVCQAISYERR